VGFSVDVKADTSRLAHTHIQLRAIGVMYLSAAAPHTQARQVWRSSEQRPKGVLPSSARVPVRFFSQTAWRSASPQSDLGRPLSCAKAQIRSSSVRFRHSATPSSWGVSCTVSLRAVPAASCCEMCVERVAQVLAAAIGAEDLDGRAVPLRDDSPPPQV
jgi:hypothetical protein